MSELKVDDRDYEQAVAQGAAERAIQPAATAVRYDQASGRIVVDFKNGAVFMVPAAALQGLAEASPEDLNKVELLGETGLHWPTLDLDFTVAGLMQGVFGTSRFTEASRRGGQSRSPSKIEAARRNGQRGGRPRKTS